MDDMLPENSFPRSALFLITVCGKSGLPTRLLKDGAFK
jgi:hypothetical protein